MHRHRSQNTIAEGIELATVLDVSRVRVPDDFREHIRTVCEKGGGGVVLKCLIPVYFLQPASANRDSKQQTVTQ